MRNPNQQEYNRRVQEYENINLQNQLQLRQLEYKKLQYEYSKLMQHFNAVQQDNYQLQDTLQQIIPENQSFKNVIQQLKTSLQSIHLKEEEYVQEIASKDRLIEQLTAEIQHLNQKSEMRVSDLSSYGKLANSMDEKSKLQDQIQQLKQQRLIQNENYEKKLVKKDELINSLNQQSLQTQNHYKDIISKKMSIISSLQEEYTYVKKSNQELQQEVKVMRQRQQEYLKEIQRLNNKVYELNNQFDNSKVTPYNTDSIQLRRAQSEQELQQLKKYSHQLSLQNQSLITQIHSLESQVAYKNKQNEHISQQLSILETNNKQLNQENNQLNKENLHLVQTLNIIEQNINKGHTPELSTVNMSKEIELKEQYFSLLQQTKNELNHNQSELQSTFNLLQSKNTQLKIKENEISQLKSTVQNNSQYISYIENTNSQLLNQKNTLINKVRQHQQNLKNITHQNQQLSMQNHQLSTLNQQSRTSQQQTFQLRQNKQALQRNLLQLTHQVTQLQHQITQLKQRNFNLQQQINTIEKQKSKNHLSLSKKSSAQHFYECNNEKQILEQQLRHTKKSLESAHTKSQQYIKQIQNLTNQNNQLKTQLEKGSPSKVIQTSYQSRYQSNNNDQQISQLKMQNRQLQQKLNQKSSKLQQKSKKMQKLQSQLRSQYETRIKALEQEIYKLSVQGGSKKEPQRSEPILIDLKDDDLMIDDLDQEFQLNQKKWNQSDIPKVQEIPSNQIESRQIQKQRQQLYPELNSKKSRSSSQSGDYKVKYEQLRVQNDSLQAHLQRLSNTLTETKEKMTLIQNQNQKLVITIQQMQDQSTNLQKKLRPLEKELAQSKQQLERFQSLKQLLKIEKQQSKEKSQTITQLQQKLTKLQKSHKQLKQDYNNLQSLNEETSQKYKKTMQNFKKEMNEMNQEILNEKNYIQDKKKEMKKLENQYIGKINLYEDENLILKSKIKKLQLQNTKLQQRVKQLEEEQIEKVIITRTQLMNYKQTEKRLQELDQQINSLLSDKSKVISEKKSLEKYFQEEITLLKTNFANQREKLLKRLTQSEQLKNQYEIKLQKLKEILEKNRKQNAELQSNLEKINKENYHIKLELSQALSETNVQLVKNKTLGQKLQILQNQLQEFKMNYHGVLLEKNKNQKDKFSQNTTKMQLDMANKQIQKLNDVLMEKQKQINYLLTKPTNDRPSKNQHYDGQNKSDLFYKSKNYNRSIENLKQKIGSRDIPFNNEKIFVQPETQTHYKSARSQIPKYNDFVKQQISYRPIQKKPFQVPELKRQQQNLHYHVPHQKFIGGFPLEFCSFTPEYHRI